MEQEQKTTTGLAGVLASMSTDTGLPLSFFSINLISINLLVLAGDGETIKEPSKCLVLLFKM